MSSLPSVQGLTLTQPQSPSHAAEIEKTSNSFQNVLTSTLEEVTAADNRGDEAIVDFNTGGATNLHDVMLAMEEADISIRMLVQMRNKALDAYNELMQLQL